MNLQIWSKVSLNKQFTSEQLGIIRQHVVKMIETGDCTPGETELIHLVNKMLDHDSAREIAHAEEIKYFQLRLKKEMKRK